VQTPYTCQQRPARGETKPPSTILALLSGLAPLRRSQGAAACPQALETRHYEQAARAPRSFYRPAAASQGNGQVRSVGFVVNAPDWKSAATVQYWISSQGAVHRRITRWVSVSAVPLAVSSWGVARPGERR
jgi:hypothetical protein